ncbi:hypothetical protein BCR44DRAFT_1436415 [Catenaria anguillulae PL171]|uniref:Uncharacterized protein n=1 Tax=Catenaria anguillulae PL171 TaxID=765915 RepID=A0A1Y2HIB8_9FUNG|nr:hypothetical protein BCR44DRAFT_1436415 [Catenaria anguillulae PL171]
MNNSELSRLRLRRSMRSMRLALRWVSLSAVAAAAQRGICDLLARRKSTSRRGMRSEYRRTFCVADDRPLPMMRLADASMGWLAYSCKNLMSVDLPCCEVPMIGATTVTFLVAAVAGKGTEVTVTDVAGPPARLLRKN